MNYAIFHKSDISDHGRRMMHVYLRGCVLFIGFWSFRQRQWSFRGHSSRLEKIKKKLVEQVFFQFLSCMISPCCILFQFLFLLSSNITCTKYFRIVLVLVVYVLIIFELLCNLTQFLHVIWILVTFSFAPGSNACFELSQSAASTEEQTDWQSANFPHGVWLWTRQLERNNWCSASQRYACSYGIILSGEISRIVLQFQSLFSLLTAQPNVQFSSQDLQMMINTQKVWICHFLVSPQKCGPLIEISELHQSNAFGECIEPYYRADIVILNSCWMSASWPNTPLKFSQSLSTLNSYFL